MTVPIIATPWMPQTYGNAPAALNVSDPLWFCDNTGVWPTPFTTALCAAASLLVHVTVSPTLIVRLAGTKANPEMLTLAVAPAAVDASAMNRRRAARAASRAARGLIGGGAACRRAPEPGADVDAVLGAGAVRPGHGVAGSDEQHVRPEREARDLDALRRRGRARREREEQEGAREHTEASRSHPHARTIPACPSPRRRSPRSRARRRDSA